jgi:glutamate racemase
LKNQNNPIGIFDSGLGGLTVLKEISRILPQEDLVYFGDIGRFPYGIRSAEVIKRFSRQNVSFLLTQKVKFIVVACNTASSVALNFLQKNFELPIIGVIKPGAQAAVKASLNKKIGVIGTVGTISSDAYAKAIFQLEKKIEVFSYPSPLFVSLAEEGYIEKPATYLIAQDYLKPLKQKQIDTLILGCTHYPLLKGVIAKVMGDKVKLIDSAQETALALKKELEKRKLLKDSKSKPKHQYFVSDLPEKLVQMAKKFLGEEAVNVKKIDINKF